MNEEILYKLPEGWKKEKIFNLVDEIKDRGEVGQTPYVEIGDIDLATKSYQFKDKESVKGCVKACKNDIILSRVRPTRGAICLINEKSTLVSNAFTVLRIRSKLLPKYLFYFLTQDSFFRYLGTKQKGTMYPSCKSEHVLDYNIKFPDIVTQELIVQEIEKQFAHLDAAVKSLKSVKNRLEVYRKSVLKAAFEGKFVKDFEYKIVKIGQFERKGGGTPSTKIKEYWNGDINWITSANIDDKNKIHYNKKITEKGLKNSSTNLIPKGSVIVVTRVGLGKVAVNDESTAISQDSQGIICKGVNPYYLMWQIKSISKEIIGKGQGTTINGITVNKLNNIEVKIPNESAQTQTVSEIESRFSVIDKLEETVNNALIKSDQLRKSILKSAFEGKLLKFKNNKQKINQ